VLAAHNGYLYVMGGNASSGALNDVRARPVSFAGKKVCIECHTDVPDKQKGGKVYLLHFESLLRKFFLDPFSLLCPCPCSSRS